MIPMKPALLLAALLVAGQASAQQVTLKCALTDPKDGRQSESWIVIDPAANYMRVNGVARTLIMSNELYAGSEQSGPFLRTATINRNTGEINESSLYQGQVVLPRNGTCEKATPPSAPKF